MTYADFIKTVDKIAYIFTAQDYAREIKKGEDAIWDCANPLSDVLKDADDAVYYVHWSADDSDLTSYTVADLKAYLQDLYKREYAQND
jgi:hypothetical protein